MIDAECTPVARQSSTDAPEVAKAGHGRVPGRIDWSAHALTLRDGPPVLATGAGSRNTVCAALGAIAAVSSPVGDLDSPQACRAHEQAARSMLAWLRGQTGTDVAAIAHDLHPDFHSSRFAATLADETGARLLPVQHHHAHIAAVVAEHGVDAPLIGLAIDGVGLGSDGTAWGGELLRVDGARFQRIGGLVQLPMPGGDRAAREPWRMAAAALHAIGRGGEIPRRFASQPAAAGVARLLENGVRCPPTSSLGRLFDAAAGLLGLCEVMRSEAEAAIGLERAATAHGSVAPLDGGWMIRDDGRLDLMPLLDTLTQPRFGEDPGAGAALFHSTVGAALADWILRAAKSTGLRTIAIGGGCSLNRLLSADLRERCEAAGLAILMPVRLSPGDDAIAFGQAAIARRTLEES
ncbi:MAG: hypothetical protein RIS35_2923 [Pseudomonadota bacterium]|jgi:hydrogenase maturation protein HypF